MDLARLRSNITLVFALAISAVVSTVAVADPPTSELNGVAKITPPAEFDAPTVVEPDRSASTIVVEVPASSIPEEDPVESSPESDRPTPDGGDAPPVAPEPFVVEDGGGLDAGDADDDASRTAAAAVLATAGEIASFDRTPIFGRSDGSSTGPGAGPPTTSTMAADQAGSWWNAPELRVFALLAVLVLAAVFMKRHGGRAIGLAGGPRPSGVVSVLGRFPFGRSASLVLLECGPRVLLLHQHAGKGGEVTTLAEFSDLDEVAELRGRLSATERDAKGGFGRELEQTLGLYDRRGRPRGFSGDEGLPVQGPIETVDLTRRRPRRGVRGN